MNDIIQTTHTNFDTAPVTDVRLEEIHDRATKEKWIHMWLLELNGDTKFDHDDLYEDNSRYFAAIENEQEVGFIRLLNKTAKFVRHCDKEVWDIDSFLVLPQHRNKGVCRKMIKLVIANHEAKMMHMSDLMFIENIDYYGSLGFTFGRIDRSDDEFDDVCWMFHHSFKAVAAEKMGLPNLDVQYVDDSRGPRLVLSGDDSAVEEEAGEVIRKVFGSTVELTNPPELVLEEVISKDAQRIWVSKYMKEYCAGFTKHEHTKMVEFWVTSNKYRFYAGKSQGQELGIVGVADSTIEFEGIYDAEVKRISMFYVLPEYRHKGVLREMISAILTPNYNVKFLSISSNLFSKHKKYFKSLGFTYSHELPLMSLTEAYINSFKPYAKKKLRRLNWFIAECDAGRDPEKQEWVDTKTEQ